MKLYHFPQTRSSRIVWMLEECGADYELVRLDIASPEGKAEARRISPMGKLPILQDRWVTVTESGAICAYLADLWPEKQLAPPAGDPERGEYYRWLFIAAGVIEPAFLQKGMGWETKNTGASGWGDPDRVEAMLRETIPGAGWLVGDHFTAADLMVGGGLQYMVGFGLLEPWAEATAYIERCTSRPAYIRAMEKAK